MEAKQRGVARWLRRGVPVAAIAAGVALIATTFSLQLFGRAYAGERVKTNFNPVMTAQGLEQQRAGLELVGGMLTGYQRASVVFARDMRMTAAQYDRFVAANYPNVAAGARNIPPAAASVFAPVVAQLRKIAPKYHEVTHIPGLGLPIPAAPWILVLAGGGLALLGVAGLVRPRAATIAAIGVLGAGMVAVPFALSLPAKTADSTDVLKIGRVALSQPAATAAHRTALAVDSMVRDLDTQMLPAIAARAHVSRAQLNATIARVAPGLATGISQWPSVAPAAYNLTAVQQASIGDLKKVDGIGYTGLEWVAIAPGIALLILAGAAMWADRPARRAVRPAEPAMAGA